MSQKGERAKHRMIGFMALFFFVNTVSALIFCVF